MNRRELLRSLGVVGALRYSDYALSDEYRYSREKYGYPNYRNWGGQSRPWEWQDSLYSVNNYSGGYEKSFPCNVIKNLSNKNELEIDLIDDIKYGYTDSIKDYFYKKPATSLLIAKNNKLIYEKYGFDRNEKMRLTSMSMAKSVTGLLLGICIDKGFIESYDDEARKYLPQLSKNYHGSITLRNLSNMSSGATISHEKDNGFIYPDAFFSRSSNISKVVSLWNGSSEKQGTRFNYNELCSLTIGMVIREVTKMKLSEFATEHLWSKIGATSDATWLTDSTKSEMNCIGFAATARDWCKLGLIFSNNGELNGNQIVSEGWIKEMTSWGEKDRQVTFGKAHGGGYKCFLWHLRLDGTLPCFVGYGGQKVMIDMKTNTVLVHTAVDEGIDYERDLKMMIAWLG